MVRQGLAILHVVIAGQLALFSTTLPVAQAQATGMLPDVWSAQDFLPETNSARLQAGLPALHLNAQLTAAAHAKALDMELHNYWAHFRPSDHKTPWSFIAESGYAYTVAGENLARGFRTPAGITSAWMHSPSHRANLLSPKYQDVGFACVPSVGPSGETVLLTVQMFAAR